MGLFKKKKDDSSSEGSEKKEEAPPTPKISIFQLFRYTSTVDRVMLIVGILVSCATGLGLPLMSIIMGNVSQNFVEIGTILMNSTDPVVIKKAKDQFSHDVIQNCLQYVYLGAGIFAAGFIQASCFLVICENLSNRFRREFFYSVMRHEIAWYDKNTSGTLSNKLFDNLERVREGTGDKVGLAFQMMAQFIGGFAVAFTYDWLLTLIMMSLSPFMMICGLFLAKLLATAATKEAKQYAVAGGIAEEVLTSIRTVIAFNGQEYECRRYEEALEHGKKTGIKKSFLIGAGLASFFVIIYASYCLAFWVGTNFVFDRRLESGTVLTVFFSVMMGSMALGQAGQQFATIGTALGAAASLYEVIDRTPEIDAYSTEGVTPEKISGRIKIQNVEFTYPTRPDVQILKDVSLEAQPGQTIALVGSSGCGKSTIIQLLQRFYNPNAGKILIDDIPIETFNIKYLRQLVGVVSQEPNLFNTSIEQNIRYGRADVDSDAINKALKEANALEFIKSFPEGLNTLVGDRGVQMSGGQKQRIAIARALVRNPKILLLDEATSALDAESESVVQAALENASRGRTTIVIAHRLSTVRNADKIIVMKAGKVMEIGTHDTLIEQKGLYHELVHAQVFADVDDKPKAKKEAERRFSRQTSERKGSVNFKSQESQVEEKAGPPPAPEPAEKEIKRLKKELEEEGAVKANLFKILKYARPEWMYIFFAIIAALIQGAVMPAFSLFFSQIINVFSNPDRDQMKKDGHFWALMFLVLAAVQGTSMLFQCAFFGVAAEGLTMRVRSKVYRNVLRQDATYFDMPKHSPGRITTRLATDAPNVKSAIDYRLGSVFNAIASICGGLGIAFYYGWQMAFLVMAIFPFMAVGQALVIKYHGGTATSDAKEMENSGKTAMEAIENIRTVQALTLQTKLYNIFCSHLDAPHSGNVSKALIRGFTYGFANSIQFFTYAAAFRFGLFLIFDDNVRMDPQNVLRVLFAISFSFGTIGFAASYFPEYIKATFAAGLIFNMLEEEPRIDGMTDAGTFPKLNGEVKLNKVFFRYPERPAVPILQGLDVHVKPGQTLALVGPSGCGKSTVISLLERLYDPLDGAVTVDSNDLRQMNPKHLRKHIALVSQEPILFDTSIRENIIYGLQPGEFTDDDISVACEKANIHKFISELPDGYNTRVGEKGTQLSGGQKQRIAIARALIRNPKILLLDEATSALDTESEKQVQVALDAAAKDRTCIVVAHRLSTIVNAGCIMVVKNGQVVEQGTHNELMAKRGAYFALTQKQSINQAGGEFDTGIAVEDDDENVKF
uniref:p-glycoprotein n=1 Tax=Caenorhabditis tropicalis TaxID=1561998 RepID=A0A1I7V2Y6_9PELO